jgi:phenylacetate-CoA ligase
MLPLLRYRTGDLAKRLDTSAMRQSLGSAQLTGLEPPAALPMIALAGREKDRLPDGRPVLDFKDALYARSVIADQLSGAFRIETSDAGHVIHLQMRQGWRGEPGDLAARIAPELPAPPGAARDDIRLWSHDDFPFGKGLDYERKFTYHQTERAAPPGHAG